MLAIGLKNQRLTDVQESDSEIEAELKLQHRVKCVEMASTLHKNKICYDPKLKSVILQWLALAEDENEFCEIRNAIEE